MIKKRLFMITMATMLLLPTQNVFAATEETYPLNSIYSENNLSQIDQVTSPFPNQSPKVVIGTIKIKKAEKKKKMQIPRKQNDFKSWMPYSVFGKNTAQAKLQRKAKTGKYGIRHVKDRMCVAVGTYYSNRVGDKLDITLKNGNKIKCIVGDVKANKDTNKKHQVCRHNGSIIEFIVNTKEMPKSVKRSGSFSSIKSLSGKITKIEKIKS